MIDIKQIRENPEKFKKAAKDKNFDVDINKLLEVDSSLKSQKSNCRIFPRTRTISASQFQSCPEMKNNLYWLVVDFVK